MKDAYIKVFDRHFTDSDDDGFGNFFTTCKIGAENGSIVIRYKEVFDELECNTSISVKDQRVTMIRSGKYRTNMIFENGKRHTCIYTTPFGELMIGIYTNAMYVNLTEDGGVLEFAYTIDNSGRLISENELKIFVNSEVE